MRNIAEIIKDDKNGKQLSQTERQIAVAYTQGKYDAIRELNIDKCRESGDKKYRPYINGNYHDGFKNGLRTAEWRYDKIRTEILEKSFEVPYENQAFNYGIRLVKLEDIEHIFNKYKTESEDKE